ncbi:hypothetical protein GGS20DRAFT_582153 [Poronia punctata]|nr:hypothetical protein GGS20DRAFT_582153 [Poronia punctata]
MPTEFHLYPRLPAEMKLMIWDEAFKELRNGAHTFRLVAKSPDGELVLEPAAKQASKDKSQWRRTAELSLVDRYSLRVAIKEGRRRSLVLYENSGQRRRVQGRARHGRAMMDPDEDLVIFRLTFGTSLIQNIMLHRRFVSHMVRLEGITQFAMDLNYVRHGYSNTRTYLPFRCPCAPGTLHSPTMCFVGVCQFLQWFVDLRTLFLILPSNEHFHYNMVSDAPRRPQALRFLRQLNGNRPGLCHFRDQTADYYELVVVERPGDMDYDPYVLGQGIRRTWAATTKFNPGDPRFENRFPRPDIEVKFLVRVNKDVQAEQDRHQPAQSKGENNNKSSTNQNN